LGRFLSCILTFLLVFSLLASCSFISKKGDSGENPPDIPDNEDIEKVPELSGIVERAVRKIADSPYLSVKTITKNTEKSSFEGLEETYWTMTSDADYDKSSGELLFTAFVVFSDKSEDEYKSLLSLRDNTAWFKENTLYKRVVPEQANEFMENKPGFTSSAFTIWDDETAQEATAEEILPVYTPYMIVFKAEDVLSETVEKLPDGNTLVTQVIKQESIQTYADMVTVTVSMMEAMDDSKSLDNSKEEMELTLTFLIDKDSNIIEYTSRFLYVYSMWDEPVWEHAVDVKAVDFSLEPVEIEFPPQSELDLFVRR